VRGATRDELRCSGAEHTVVMLLAVTAARLVRLYGGCLDERSRIGET
jgi:hypothetical protein